MAEVEEKKPKPAAAFPLVFVNLPVKDLNKSIEFFTKALGFKLNPQFSNEQAACVVISDYIYAMLLVEPFFKTFTEKELVDGHKSIESITALSLESKERVNELADAALAGGGHFANDIQDSGFMYSRSFHDPDGHLWELFWMDTTACQEHYADKEKAEKTDKTCSNSC